MQNPSSALVTNPALVTKVRSASRDLVRELGFMSRTLAGTELSPSAVHAIIEINAAGRLSSKKLSEKLLLEKSTISRLVKSLVDGGEVGEVRSDEDARSKRLYLTARGRKTISGIAKFAEQQVAEAISPLSDPARRDILTGLETYAAALKVSRTSGEITIPENPITIGQGHTPGMIGRIVEMHASYYSRSAGFGAAFESKVAGGLADFVSRLGNPGNAIWTAEKDGRIVGSIAIDAEDLGGREAHLRWFILDDGMRGAGVGKALLQSAIAFCDDREFRETHLWTFKGLDAARNLYESHGFRLTEEKLGNQWGAEVLEQKFVRPQGG